MYRSHRTKRASRTIGMLSLIFLLALVFMPSSNAAAADKATLKVERLVGTSVGITIDFPTEISGSFGGTLNGKHFDCETIPPNKLYCIGPFAYWVGPATLHIYVQGSGEVIFSRVISVPPSNSDSGIPPTPPPPPQRETELL